MLSEAYLIECFFIFVIIKTLNNTCYSKRGIRFLAGEVSTYSPPPPQLPLPSAFTISSINILRNCSTRIMRVSALKSIPRVRQKYLQIRFVERSERTYKHALCIHSSTVVRPLENKQFCFSRVTMYIVVPYDLLTLQNPCVGMYNIIMVPVEFYLSENA